MALEELANGIDPRARTEGHAAMGADLPWRDWYARYFFTAYSKPFSPRHVRLWDWFEALTPGVKPRPRVDIWPRGGGKSTTGEFGCCRVGVKLTRRYALYVSGTQLQADKHVQAVATLLEGAGIGRAENRYGVSKGWRRDELRTANGFNVSAYGLDTALRGIKLDQYRPDLIIFDDIDSLEDSERTVQKKIDAITSSIIPAGSSDCAILFLQNLIHEDGIVSQLQDGRADFLHNREVPTLEPAVLDLRYELAQVDGRNEYRITGGTPTWEGQDLAVCEAQMNEWGKRAFLREAQQEVHGAEGYFFDVSKLNYIEPEEVPPGLRRCRAWDIAATEGGGDKTVGHLGGKSGDRYYILDVRSGQWASDRVRNNIREAAEMDGPGVTLRLPQDPGQAGKDQAEQYRILLRKFHPIIKPVTGKKWTRAQGWAECVNRGNCYVVRAPWNRAMVEAMRRFKEDENDQEDDEIDAGSDTYNELFPVRIVKAKAGPTPAARPGFRP